MKINWKLRLKNKATLIAIVAALVAVIYTILGAFGIVPPVAQDLWVQMFALVLEVLIAFGIVIDPTTQGVSDSTQALNYEKPKISNPTVEHTINTIDGNVPKEDIVTDGEVTPEVQEE